MTLPERSELSDLSASGARPGDDSRGLIHALVVVAQDLGVAAERS
jgi:hypothetical protein